MAAPLPTVPPVAAEVPQGPAVRKRKAKTQLEPLADAGEAGAVETGPAVVLSNGRLTAILPALDPAAAEAASELDEAHDAKKKRDTSRYAVTSRGEACASAYGVLCRCSHVSCESAVCLCPSCLYPAIGSPCARGSTLWESAFCTGCA